MEESVDGLEEWRDLVMSPKGLSPGFASRACINKSVADVLSGTDGILDHNYEKEFDNLMLNSEKKVDGCENGFNSSSIIDGDAVDIKTRGGSITERRAAKFGFIAAKISNPRFTSSSPLPSLGVRSPYLTITPGISPTALLDSLILVPNPQPSPTTGTFASPPADESNISESHADVDKGIDDLPSPLFRPRADPNLGCVPVA